MTYSEAFYEASRPMSLSSAQVVLGKIHKMYPFKSMVDFGCGSNTWIEAARDLGVADTLGIDSTGTDPDLVADLSQPIDLGRKYDLAVSVEVGEHLPEEAAGAFVANIVHASDVVVFSAAIPGQPGVSHVNVQWQSWWAAKFREHGFFVSGSFRWLIWDDSRVENFYRQNILIAARLKLAAMPWDERVIDCVHPDRVTPGWDEVR